MNSLPPEDDDAIEVDALYRRASAASAGAPDHKVRERVLAHAHQLAMRSSHEALDKPDFSWQRPQRAWRRPAAFGALAAALLAVFMWKHPITAPPPVAMQARPSAQVPVAGGPVFADIGTEQAKAMPHAVAMPVRPAHPAIQAPPPPTLVAGNMRQFAPADAVSAPEPQLARAADAATARASAGGARVAGSATTTASAVPLNAPTASPAGTQGAELWRAAGEGDLATLRRLLEQHANLDLQDGEGRTALMIATLHGRSQAVSWLLEAGANPNLPDSSGESPLDAALAADESEIIAALKRHGGR
jgi:Ankyrin repeats (many copies)